MARAAVQFFTERMRVLHASSTFDHQGKEIKSSGWLGGEYVEFDAVTEWDHRNVALAWIRANWPDTDRIWLLDGDEFYSDDGYEALRQAVEQTESDSWWVTRETYWKTPMWKVSPREEVHSCFAIDPRRVSAFTWIRTPHGHGQMLGDGRCQKGTDLLITGALQHHLTTVRTEAEMALKIARFSHASEILPGWFENVFKAWVPEMEDLHPTKPAVWKKAVPVSPDDLPESVLRLLPSLARV